jgi:hypothetical protein
MIEVCLVMNGADASISADLAFLFDHAPPFMLFLPSLKVDYFGGHFRSPGSGAAFGWWRM